MYTIQCTHYNNILQYILYTVLHCTLMYYNVKCAVYHVYQCITIHTVQCITLYTYICIYNTIVMNQLIHDSYTNIHTIYTQINTNIYIKWRKSCFTSLPLEVFLAWFGRYEHIFFPSPY